jgi:cold shock CspA family protein
MARSNTQERFLGTFARQVRETFFFIRYDAGPHEIFAHVNQLLPGSVQPKVGDKASFVVEIDARCGKPQAIEIACLPRDLFPPEE